MTLLFIIGLLLLGLITLIIGFITKIKWVKIVSIIPLGISGWQLLTMFLL